MILALIVYLIGSIVAYRLHLKFMREASANGKLFPEEYALANIFCLLSWIAAAMIGSYYFHKWDKNKKK